MPRAFPAIRPTCDADFGGDDRQFTGALSGLVNPGLLAESVLGDTLPFGQLFAYCYRRFGPPNAPGDDYKEIAQYMLTTPMEGVFIWVSIRPSTSPRFQFGYMVDEALHSRALADDRRQNERRIAEFDAWMERRKKGSSTDTAARREAWWDFIKENPEPTGSARPRGPMRSIELALIASIRELLRPISVRDSYFNAVGDIKDQPRNEAIAAKPHASAGYAMPSEFFRDPQRWERVVNHCSSLGGGDLDQGLTNLLNTAEKPPRKPSKKPTKSR